MKIFTLIAIFSMFAFTSSAQLVDGDLETGAAGYWNESSTNFGTPLCDAGCGNCGGPCAPQSGAWYAWFGGAGGADEVGSFDQDLTIPSGSSATLSFYAMIATNGSGSTEDILSVQMDGVTQWSITGADSADYGTYQMVEVNISSYADGGGHWLNISGDNLSGSNINMLVDNMSLTVDGVEAVGINEILNRESEIIIYPNPAVNELNVTFNQEMRGNALVRVYNLSGQLVNEETLSAIYSKTFSMNTSNLENGLYYLEVLAGDEVITKNFMIQR